MKTLNDSIKESFEILLENISFKKRRELQPVIRALIICCVV